MSNLDMSSINLDSGGHNSQTRPVNHEVVEFQLSGITLDQSGDES